MASPWTDKIRQQEASNRRANAFLYYLVEFSENCRQCRLRGGLFDGQRIGGRADRARDRDGGRDEQELVDAILGAILGEIRDVEDLAHGQPHDRDRDPVPRLIDARLRFVRTDLAAPGVAGDRGDLGPLDPLERLEREAGRVSTRVAVPASGLKLRLHLPGAHHDEIAALDLYPAGLRGAIEVRPGDGIAVLERVLAERTRDVEKDAAAHHLLLGLLDP